MSYGNWLPAESAARVLRDQAAANAKRLGHELGSWTACGATWLATCDRCHKSATVHARELGSEALRGVVVTMPCAPTARDRLEAARAGAGLPPPGTTAPWPAHAWGPLGAHTPPSYQPKRVPACGCPTGFACTRCTPQLPPHGGCCGPGAVCSRPNCTGTPHYRWPIGSFPSTPRNFLP